MHLSVWVCGNAASLEEMELDAEERKQVVESTGKAIELLKGSKKEHKKGILALLKLTGKKEVSWTPHCSVVSLARDPLQKRFFFLFASSFLFFSFFLLLSRSLASLHSMWPRPPKNGWTSRAVP